MTTVATSRNDLCACHKSGAWRTRERAQAALERILAEPLDPTRLYAPSGVERCPAGIWHLTSKTGKRWAKGKASRRRAR